MSTVLLVDDNAAFVENFEEILSNEGYAVRSAGSCAAARAEAAAGFQGAPVARRLPAGTLARSRVDSVRASADGKAGSMASRGFDNSPRLSRCTVNACAR